MKIAGTPSSAPTGAGERSLYQIVKDGENVPRGEVALTVPEANWMRLAWRQAGVPFQLVEKIGEYEAGGD